MFNSKKTFGQIEAYVPDESDTTITAHPLGTPVSESGIELGNSKTDGIYTAFTASHQKVNSIPTISSRKNRTKEFENIIDEHLKENEESSSWIGMVIGFVVTLILLFIGIYILAALVNQFPTP